MLSAEISTQMFSMGSVQLSCAVQSSATRNALCVCVCVCVCVLFSPSAGACWVTVEDWSA